MEFEFAALVAPLLNLGVPFVKEWLSRPWSSNEKADEKAAWEMYVEMITRITTQPLPPDHGDEKTALKSVYSLFEITRNVLKEHGQDCDAFPKVAITILNQEIRPFTAKWHSESLKNAFDDPDKRAEFREELALLQKILNAYTAVLARMAKVEDLTNLSEE